MRVSLERPDSITASAVSAREDIARAVAEQIRSLDDTRDLKQIAEDVLPKLEKFLESPEEKRLRRVRAGVIVAAAGVGFSAIMALLAAVSQGSDEAGFIAALGFGVAAFFIGIGLIINALAFTRVRKQIDDQSSAAQMQNLLDAHARPQIRAGVEAPPTFRSQTTSNLTTPSVTEGTTRHLKNQG